MCNGGPSYPIPFDEDEADTIIDDSFFEEAKFHEDHED